jgi:hypothetical protein
MNSNTAVLAHKIRELSPEQVAEVDAFVEFLRLRSQERGITRGATALSAAAFEAVWANPEDDAYDAL